MLGFTYGQKCMDTPPNDRDQVFPVKGTINATACKDILDNCCLSTLQQQFEEGSFLFHHDCAL